MPAHIPPSTDQLHDLEVLVNAHHPLWLIESVEENRVETLLTYVAQRMRLPFFVWSPAKGLVRKGDDALVARKPGKELPKPAAAGTQSIDGCMKFIEQVDLEAIFYLPGARIDSENAALIARVKEVYRLYFKHRGAVVVSGADVPLPLDLEPLFTPVDLPVPSAQAYHRFVTQVLRDIGSRRAVSVEMNSSDVTALIQALHGLSFFEVRKIITQAVVEDGRLGPHDLARVMDAKRRIVERSGVLEYFPHDHAMTDVAGLGQLKDWLRKRRVAFADPERAKSFGLSPPKGLLLLGVQGCGKSLCAKAVAAEWRLPLLRLDPGNLYTKFFGESEKNLRRAIKTAEDMAPVVLWLDEIEKALGQGDQDGGTSQRIFGTFLAWMQEKKESVFVIATANDISKLPPELLRKGRFDEIFFVDLPTQTTREAILEVHLRRRERDPAGFDVAHLASITGGFSGAELEQVVVSALYSAFAQDRDIDDALLVAEVHATRPLSVTMSEKIDALRAWAQERAVAAE